MTAEFLFDLMCNFFKFEGAPNFWEIVNSPILVAGFAAYATWIVKKRFDEVAGKAEDNQANSQAIEELNSEIEDAPEQPIPAQQENGDHFSEAASIIQELKEFVEKNIKNLKDGRNRRKYRSTVGRRDYRVRVIALDNDGGLKEDQRGELIHAFHIWRPHQTHQQPTPIHILEQLTGIRDRLGIEPAR